ncbi:MAG TPA: type I-E CRISPR-associated protein Cas5/CasD [Sphingomicrobium sp.]|nr:type I-E CRISPR-associated protein Cas5/CasD [Sphingomicrobium sp.]
MTRWLVVTLMAPLASFGERAGNVERPTADRPTRSALIGLAGAALGIHRADHEGQRRLAASFRVATATLRAGSLVSDFHTYQSLPSSSRPPPQTRAEALSRRTDLVTSITRREYRADVWHEAAYALQEGAHWKLEDLSEAFRAPRFTLSLGRKSCPLSAPLDPKIIESDDLVELFQRRADSAWLDSSKSVLARRHWRHRRGPIAAERREDLGTANRRTRQHRRHDEPGDRLSWQFSARREFVLPGIEEEET